MKKFLPLLMFFLTSIALAINLENIKPRDAEKMQKNKKAIIIDVREPSELKNGMVKEALPLPKSLMDDKKNEWENIVRTLPKDKTLILYCGSGKRAEIVGAKLVTLGFRVLNMQSFDSWKKKGLPTEKGK